MSESKSKVKNVIISSLTDYIAQILELQPIESDSKLIPQSLVYRGLADST